MIPSELLVHVATVEPYVDGEFGEAFELPCYFEQRVTTEQRDAEGSAVADAMLYADPATETTTVPAGSRLTVNRTGATVLSVEDYDDGGITPLAHREMALRVWPLTA